MNPVNNFVLSFSCEDEKCDQPRQDSSESSFSPIQKVIEASSGVISSPFEGKEREGGMDSLIRRSLTSDQFEEASQRYSFFFRLFNQMAEHTSIVTLLECVRVIPQDEEDRFLLEFEGEKERFNQEFSLWKALNILCPDEERKTEFAAILKRDFPCHLLESKEFQEAFVSKDFEMQKAIVLRGSFFSTYVALNKDASVETMMKSLKGVSKEKEALFFELLKQYAFTSEGFANASEVLQKGYFRFHDPFNRMFIQGMKKACQASNQEISEYLGLERNGESVTDFQTYYFLKKLSPFLVQACEEGRLDFSVFFRENRFKKFLQIPKNQEEESLFVDRFQFFERFAFEYKDSTLDTMFRCVKDVPKELENAFFDGVSRKYFMKRTFVEALPIVQRGYLIASSLNHNFATINIEEFISLSLENQEKILLNLELVFRLKREHSLQEIVLYLNEVEAPSIGEFAAWFRQRAPVVSKTLLRIQEHIKTKEGLCAFLERSSDYFINDIERENISQSAKARSIEKLLEIFYQEDLKVLEVEEATEPTLKKAYRKLALERHPDKGGDVRDFKILSISFQRLLELTK